MTDNQLHTILDKIFFRFENNIFTNTGVWPRKANLVFAFADYIEEMKDTEIAVYLNSDDAELIDRFRAAARKGIEIWLTENMKTLVI